MSYRGRRASAADAKLRVPSLAMPGPGRGYPSAQGSEFGLPVGNGPTNGTQSEAAMRPGRSKRSSFAQARSRAVVQLWTKAKAWGAIGHHSDHAQRFGAFGHGSIIMFPWNTLYGEKWMRIGSNTMIGEGVTLSVGIHPEQIPVSNPALTIGDRCLINKGTAIVAHFAIEIGDDVFTGHNCYITDQNHGYEDLTQPIGAQSMPEKPVRIGSGSWLGHGVIVVPGVTIGKHVTVAGGSVVTRDVPDRCVVAGAPARIVRRYVEGEGWISVDRT